MSNLKTKQNKTITLSFPKPNARWPPVTQIIIHHYFMMQSAGPWSLRDHLPACVSTTPHSARKGQPIRTDLTAPLHNQTNYLYIYLIRLLPHSSAPLPSVSFSLSAPLCTKVNPNSDPNPLLIPISIEEYNLCMKNTHRVCHQSSIKTIARCNIMHNPDFHQKQAHLPNEKDQPLHAHVLLSRWSRYVFFSQKQH